jgi:hypothetical protein
MLKTATKIALLLGLLAAIAFGVSLFIPDRPPVARKPLPVPNGYDRLVEAGRLVASIPNDFYKLDTNSLAAIVSANSNALANAREALLIESQVPFQSTSAYMSSHIREIESLRTLAQVFAVETRLAALEGRSSDVARSALDIINLASKAGAQGLLIDAMIGSAIEKMGTSELTPLISRLDAASCRSAAGQLDAIERTREPFSDIWERERENMRHAPGGFRARMGAWFSSKSLKSSIAKFEGQYQDGRRKNRELILQLASRAFELEEGRKATNALELVPGILSELPVDPTTSTNMIALP